MTETESINKQLDFTIGGCKASIILNNGFINSSFTSPGNMHTHPYFEIHFIIHGENRVRFPNSTITADTGDILIVPPEQPHCFVPVANTGGHKRAAFWADLNIMGVKSTDRFIFDTLYSLKGIVCITDSFGGIHAVEEIQSEIIGKKPCYETMLINAFSRLLIQLCRCIENNSLKGMQENEARKSRMLLIEEYLQKNYKGDCTIKEMANHLHISRRQLTRLIHGLFGKSFRRMLLELRMSMANWLIEEKDAAFEEIANEVGYGSLAAFYHAYLEFYGCTPGEHRKHSRVIDN
jgi:AraC-like DNA-binding protein